MAADHLTPDAPGHCQPHANKPNCGLLPPIHLAAREAAAFVEDTRWLVVNRDGSAAWFSSDAEAMRSMQGGAFSVRWFEVWPKINSISDFAETQEVPNAR